MSPVHGVMQCASSPATPAAAWLPSANTTGSPSSANLQRLPGLRCALSSARVLSLEPVVASQKKSKGARVVLTMAAVTPTESEGKEKEAKLWGGRFEESVTAAVEQFSQSVSYDKKLYKHDLMGSRAHAAMLSKQVHPVELHAVLRLQGC